MCQNRTCSQKPLSGACAKVQGHATTQLQLSNQSPVMCQLGISVMTDDLRWLQLCRDIVDLRRQWVHGKIANRMDRGLPAILCCRVRGVVAAPSAARQLTGPLTDLPGDAQDAQSQKRLS